jgi:hypothetical protein
VGKALDRTFWHPQLMPGGTIRGDLYLDGATGYYELGMSGADKTLSADEVYSSYQGQFYSEDTPVLTRVTTRFQGQIEPPSSSFIRIPLGIGGINPVRQVSHQMVFDPSSLTITSSATVTLDNWHGVDYTRFTTGVGAFGNVGVGLMLGHAHQQFKAPYGRFGMPRFWGMSDTRGFNTSPGGSPSTMTLICVDQTQQLQESLVAAPPDMDGHNHYWAMAFLAQLAGIPVSKLAFAHLVPDDPYSFTRYDTEPYFLPMGAGMHPWTPVNRTLSVLSLMEQIRKATGFMQYFDTQGYLHYEPFSPINSYLAGVKRIFTHTAFPSYTGRDWQGGLTEIKNLSISSSVRDVRNQTLLIGVDSEHSWGVIGSKLEDAPSISSPAGSQPVNYKGYKSPFVWMDSRFANEGFALRSSLSLFRWLRQPAITATFECWPQYDLYPLDMIYIDDWRTGALGIPFFIMSMSMTSVSHGLPPCTITARYLDPFLLSG